MSVFTLEFGGFIVSDDESCLPNYAGIYVVYRCVHNAAARQVTLQEVLYIGESNDVRGRVVCHPRKPDWNRHLRFGEKLCYATAPIGNRREQAEAALIFKHSPKENEEYKYSFPYEATRVLSKGTTGLLQSDFVVQTSTLSSLFGR